MGLIPIDKHIPSYSCSFSNDDKETRVKNADQWLNKIMQINNQQWPEQPVMFVPKSYTDKLTLPDDAIIIPYDNRISILEKTGDALATSSFFLRISKILKEDDELRQNVDKIPEIAKKLLKGIEKRVIPKRHPLTFEKLVEIVENKDKIPQGQLHRLTRDLGYASSVSRFNKMYKDLKIFKNWK
jgi:hypothetical protein